MRNEPICQVGSRCGVASSWQTRETNPPACAGTEIRILQNEPTAGQRAVRFEKLTKRTHRRAGHDPPSGSETDIIRSE